MAYWVIIIKSMQEFFGRRHLKKGVLIHDGVWCGKTWLYLERKRQRKEFERSKFIRQARHCESVACFPAAITPARPSFRNEQQLISSDFSRSELLRLNDLCWTACRGLPGRVVTIPVQLRRSPGEQCKLPGERGIKWTRQVNRS